MNEYIRLELYLYDIIPFHVSKKKVMRYNTKSTLKVYSEVKKTTHHLSSQFQSASAATNRSNLQWESQSSC